MVPRSLIVIEVAKLCWGVKYKYGGNNPMTGLDCSGFVCECLRSVGLVGHFEDLSAQLLFNKFESGDTKPVPGALAFFGKDFKSISHVGLMIDENLMIEAGGGDSTTVTREKAEERNAFVRIRPVYYRKDFLGVRCPKY